MTINQGPRFRALAYACVLGLLVPWWIATCTRTAPRRALILATTTSVGNSGLLDALLPSFRGDSGLEVFPQPIGSGLALRMLAAGQADVALTHAPDAEAAALAKHPRWFYRKLMFNDFVIVGPANDPSLVAQARSAPEAFRRIVASHALFISRGDGSGTEERETLLWKLAGVTPARDQRVIAGAGMGATLRIADQMKAYTLSDRATFAQNAHALAARLLFQGDPQLLNTYAVVHDNNAPAEAFAEWLLRGRGRALIAAYRIGGQPAFSVWPIARPDRDPHDLPR